MKNLSPNFKKRRIKKKTGARDQKRGTKKVCSDGACAVPKYSLNYQNIKPLSRKRVSPNRKIKIKGKNDVKKFKDAIAYPGMKIKRRTSSINRSLQKKKTFDPFPAQLRRRDSSFARSLDKKLNRVSPTRKIKRTKNAIAYPGMKIKRHDSSIARSLQRKYNLYNDNKFDPFPAQLRRRDSSFARSLQMKMDKSLARSLQEKHDLSAAKFLNRLINRI